MSATRDAREAETEERDSFLQRVARIEPLAGPAPVASASTRLGPYVLEQKLGQGGMGAVYRARAHDSQEIVALKTMLRVSPDSILRFKREFRASQSIRHRHLVRLGELAVHDDIWFFTMEYIEGLDVERYLARPLPLTDDGYPGDSADPALVTTLPVARAERRSPPESAHHGRIRVVFAQIVSGLMAVHAAGKLHRDVKPQNIMVDRNDRVVILDFGLVLDVSDDASQSLDSFAVGTPAYMAPEQVRLEALTERADWYSLGVMLFQFLTGRLPLTGPPLTVMHAKQELDPPDPRDLAPDCPPDLAELCMQLMSLDPHARPDGDAILAALAAPTAPTAPTDDGELDRRGPASDLSARQRDTQTGTPFLGRQAELGALFAAYERVQTRGTPHAVFVHGESGVGKSALMRHFLRAFDTRARPTPSAASNPDENPEQPLAPARSGVERLSLIGRCYQREWMPYKAVDGVIDALVRFMRRLPTAQSAALTPRNAGLLLQMFPVLGKVESLALAPVRPVPDPQQRRRLAFAALRELLHKLCERYSLILAIDDIQWTDAESLDLLRELLRPPDAPALLLVMTRRPSDVAMPTLPCSTERIEVGPMCDRDADALARWLLDHRRTGRGTRPIKNISVEHLRREAGDHPMYMSELVLYLDAGESRQTGPAIRLDSVIWTRVSRLDEPARRLLGLIALADAPMSPEVLARASEMSESRVTQVVTALCDAQLARIGHFSLTSSRAEEFRVQPYHDRVRESVAAHLSDEQRRLMHSALAAALEAVSPSSPLSLLYHQRAAGLTDKAARQADLAAREAASALAYERAAEYYALALELAPERDPKRIRTALAESLWRAGRYRESDTHYEILARDSDSEERLHFLIKRVDCLLSSWSVGSGSAVLHELMRAMGARYPGSEGAAIAELWLRYQALRWALKPVEYRPVDAMDSEQRLLLELYVTAYYGSLGFDPLRALVFLMRAWLLARKLGHELLIARLAIEVYWIGIHMGRPHEHSAQQALRGFTERYLEARTDSADSEQVDPALLGAYRLLTGPSIYSTVRWTGAELDRHFSDIDAVLVRSGTVTVTLGMVHMHWVAALLRAGDWTLMRTRLADFMADARHRRDSFNELTLQGFKTPMFWLDDQPEEARLDLGRVRRETTRLGVRGVEIGVWVPLVNNQFYQDVVYERRPHEPEDIQRLPGVMGGIQWWRVQFAWLRGRQALFRARHGRLSVKAAVRSASKHASALEREACDDAVVFGHLLRARIALFEDRRERAIEHLASATDAAETGGLRMYAAMCQLRLSELLPAGQRSQTLRERAMEWIDEQGLANPDRMANVAICLREPE